MNRRWLALLSLLIVISMALTACVQATTPAESPAPTAVPEQAEESTAAPAEEGVIKVGQVTDTGGIDDRSFNETAWRGVERAIEDFGIVGNYLESQQLTDYATNINEFLRQEYDLIIPVGFLIATATADAARENPDTLFAIVDYEYPDCWPGAVPGKDCGSDVALDNVIGLTFAADQAAYLAGYLAAGMTETGVVGTFGGMRIPTVTYFMVGFQSGIEYYNEQKGTDVRLIGWKTDASKDGGGDGLFTGNFESTDDGRRFAEQLIDEGADIIMPVAGPVGEGTAAAIQERGGMMIGVDADWYFTSPQYKDVILTSVLKNMDVTVYNTIQSVIDGTFEGGTSFVGTLVNGGVGLSPFHDYDDEVLQELKDEIEQIEQALINGELETGWPVVAE